MQLVNVESGDEFQQLLRSEEFDFQCTCGYNKQIQFHNIREFFRGVFLHYVVYSIHAELAQLKNRLMNTLQIDTPARGCPIELWSLLACNKKEGKLLAADIEDLFEVNYSPNQRAQEENVILFYYNFLQEFEGEFSVYTCIPG